MFPVVMSVILVVTVVIGLVLIFRKMNQPKARLSDRSVGAISPDGLQVVMSVGSEKKPLPVATDVMEIAERSPKVKKYSCGHSGAVWFVMDLFGEHSKRFKDNPRCPECEIVRWKKHCIKCASCGLIITPGDAVALYHESSPGLLVQTAKKVGDSYIGCMRWDCCPCGGFFSGYWTENGFKPAFESSTAAGESARTGKITITEI
jgi:hypothetical protein